MQFTVDAPGNLTQDGATFYGDWTVSPGNIGYTPEEVADYVSSALNDARGIEATGIITRQQASIPLGSPGLIFQVVETIEGDANILGITYWNGSRPYLIQIEAAYFGNPDIVTHEAIHGWLLAMHSPPNTDSIMEPAEDPGDEWLSALDIEQIVNWLASAPMDQTFWFPSDLDSYITQRTIPDGARVRFVATVLDPLEAVIRPVYALAYEDLIAGDWAYLARGIGCHSTGFHETEWQESLVSGEFYIGIVVETESAVTIDGLAIGLAEVQLSATGEGGGSPIPN